MANKYRTIYCGEITEQEIDKEEMKKELYKL